MHYEYSEDAPIPPAEDRPTSPRPRKSSGAVNLGDVLAKVSIRPTQAMLDLAQKADVPGSSEPIPAADQPYDPIAIATYWSDLGYKVMPLKSMAEVRHGGFPDDQAGKIPSLKGKQYEQGTRDPEVIRQWWGEDPGRGVGLPSQANGLLMVDIDNDRHLFGELYFMEMCAEIGIDPNEVPMSKSPSYHGGYHLYYRLPATFPKMSLPAVSLIARNVDLPWFVVAPGSWKYTTLGYTHRDEPVKGIGIQTWYAGDPASIPMAPKALLDKLMRRGAIKGVPATETSRIERVSHRTGSDGKIDIEYYEKNGIPLGLVGLGQNGALYRIACKMAGKSMRVPEKEAVDWCWKIISNSPTKPHKGPWTYEQVEKLVAGAYEWVPKDERETDRLRAAFLTNLLNNSPKGLLK